MTKNKVSSVSQRKHTSKDSSLRKHNLSVLPVMQAGKRGTTWATAHTDGQAHPACTPCAESKSQTHTLLNILIKQNRKKVTQ